MSILSSIFGSKPDYSKVQSPYQQTQALVPGLPTMTSTAAGDIQSELSGQLSPDVTAQIRNAGATWGAASGMPGSGAAGNVTLESLGLTSLGEKQSGMSDYYKFLSGVGSEQMPVSTQMTMAESAAAPNPVATGILDLLSTITGGYLGSRKTNTQPSQQSSSGSTGTTDASTGATNAVSGSVPTLNDFSGFDISSLYGGVGAGADLSSLFSVGGDGSMEGQY